MDLSDPTDYTKAKHHAQAAADEYGYDYGIEKIGVRWHIFMLPQKANRCGHELQCEVVSCTNLAHCQKGHGP